MRRFVPMRYLLLFLTALFVTSAAHGQALVLSACGTGNYTASIGSLHQLTMDPAGYLCVSTTTLGALEATPPLPEMPKPSTDVPRLKK
jgi:hypothetical protein